MINNTDRRVVVTGASGHIGYNVTKQLLERSYDVLILVRSKNENVHSLILNGAKCFVCDLFQPDTYRHKLENIGSAFHIAGTNTTRFSNENQTIAGTSELTSIFLNACVDAHVPKIIYTSSVVVLGRSYSDKILISEDDLTSTKESPYVEGKLAAEHIARKLTKTKNVDIRIVYPAWVLGPGDTKITPPNQVVLDYLQKRGQFFYFKGGISVCSVDSVAEGHVNACEIGEYGGRYILGGDNIKFIEFFTLLSKLAKLKRPIIRIPKWLIIIGSVVTKKLLTPFQIAPPLEPSYAKSVIGNYSWYDSSKAIDSIGYKIVPAEQILEKAILDSRKHSLMTYKLGYRHSENCNVSLTYKKPLLITGVPGWLGNRLIEILINGDKQGRYMSNRKVVLFVQDKYRHLLDLPDNFEIVYGDLTCPKSIRRALGNISTVFHFAAAVYPSKISELYKVNHQGTVNLVDACIEKGIRRIVYASTDAICGHGTADDRIFGSKQKSAPYKQYGKSKYLAEKYILEKTREGLVDGTSLRAFWFFGPHAPNRQTRFFRSLKLPRQIVFGGGDNFRSITHVDNFIQAFLRAENCAKSVGKWYWICGNETRLTVDKIYELMCNSINQKYRPLYIPIWVCKILGAADTILGWIGRLNPTLHAAGKFYYDIAGDCTEAKKDFGYDPSISIDEAVLELSKISNKNK